MIVDEVLSRENLNAALPSGKSQRWGARSRRDERQRVEGILEKALGNTGEKADPDKESVRLRFFTSTFEIRHSHFPLTRPLGRGPSGAPSLRLEPRLRREPNGPRR
jgi:hypothetical protein